VAVSFCDEKLKTQYALYRFFEEYQSYTLKTLCLFCTGTADCRTSDQLWREANAVRRAVIEQLTRDAGCAFWRDVRNYTFRADVAFPVLSRVKTGRKMTAAPPGESIASYIESPVHSRDAYLTCPSIHCDTESEPFTVCFCFCAQQVLRWNCETSAIPYRSILVLQQSSGQNVENVWQFAQHFSHDPIKGTVMITTESRDI